MKASELRIGNLVNDNGYNSIIGVIDSHYHSIQISGSPRTIALETIEPIPLTEEWMLKFGFKPSEAKTAKKYIYYSDSYNFRKAKVICTEKYGSRVVIAGTVIEIKYIHQLQNLYFALTGKELELK